MPKKREIIDLIGKVFNRLTVISFAYLKNGNSYWNCKCECGNEKIIARPDLISNRTKSCGCLQKELRSIRVTNLKGLRRTHGMEGTPEYATWRGIKARCYNPKNKCYKDYGGRGIKICDEWKDSFETFYKDMGPRPIEEGVRYSIDRIDVNGNYSKDNCRWATDLEQARNKRNSRNIEWNGKTQCLVEWSKELFPNSKSNIIQQRIFALNWSIEKAFTTSHGI